MLPNDWRMHLEDILECVGKVETYIRGLEYEDFARDSLRVDAVLYNLTIIGEAATRVPADVRQRMPEVPWDKMRALRNVIVHSYQDVRLAIIFETARHRLPELLDPLQGALETDAGAPGIAREATKP